MEDDAKLLDIKTLEMLMNGSRQFERKEDRSFLIVGNYAITTDSVAPVSLHIMISYRPAKTYNWPHSLTTEFQFLAYMVSAVMFLNRSLF